MARYIKEIELGIAPEKVEEILEDFTLMMLVSSTTNFSAPEGQYQLLH